MFISVENIRSLKSYNGKGTKSQWAVFLTGMDKAQVVSVPYGTLEAMPKLKIDRAQVIAGAAIHTESVPQTQEGPSKPEPKIETAPPSDVAAPNDTPSIPDDFDPTRPVKK